MWLFNPRSRLYWPCLEFVPPMFTRHLVFRIILPSCSKFFSEKITLARRGRMAAKRGSIPPIPPTWVWICAQTPGNVTFPSLLSLSSRCSLLLHDLNPSFTVKPSLAPPFWKSLSLFSPSSHCFARPPLSSSLTFGSEERNSWSVRTLR